MLSPPFPFTRHGARFSQRPARDLGDLWFQALAQTAKSIETLSARRKAAEDAEKCSTRQLFQHRAAALAYRGIRLVLADVRGVVPAAFALGAVSFLHLHENTAGAVA